MPPEISLLVPCHNAEAFLPRFADCIRGLNTPFTRVLLYDDGSTDDTYDRAVREGFEVLRGGINRGVAHARNQLAANAATEWIKFHDVDDIILPDFIDRLSPFCGEATDVVSCDSDWVEAISAKPIIRWRHDPRGLARDPFKHLLGQAMSLNNTIIRRSAWRQVGGCDERLKMWEDSDIHIRLAHAGFRFQHVPEVLTIALRRTDSFSHDYRRSWQCRLLALEGYARQRLEGPARAALAEAAETAARELAELAEHEAARKAIELAQSLGATVPSSRSWVIGALRPFVPPLRLLRLQGACRRLAAARKARRANFVQGVQKKPTRKNGH